MKRVLLGTAFLVTMAFGFASIASAVTYSLSDPKSLASLFEQDGVVGHQLTGAEVAALSGTTYEVLVFSAYSVAKTTVYADNNAVYWLNNTGNGAISRSVGEFALEELKLVYYTDYTYNVAEQSYYENGGKFQAYILDEEVTINGVLYGVGSIFIGFEDGTDLDYNDVVLAFRALSAPAVPIPAAAWLLGTGVAGLVALRRKGALARQ